MSRPYNLRSLSHAITRHGTVQHFYLAFCEKIAGERKSLQVHVSGFRPWEDSDLPEERVGEPPEPADRPEPLTVHER